MILEYSDDLVIYVYEPSVNDPLSPVVVELQPLPPAQTLGRALVFAFRLRDKPNNFRVFAFKLVSYRGLELLLSEIAMSLRDLRRWVPSPESDDWIPSPVLSCAPRVQSPGATRVVNPTADQICEGFEPSHSFEAEWDGRCRLELVFVSCLVRADHERLGLGRGRGIPLQFSSPAATSHFIAIFDAEVNRVLRLVQDGRF